MECRECGLHAFSCPSCIPGKGKKDVDIMIINSYASDECEDAQEAQMDKYLKDYLAREEIKAKDVYYTNAIKCRTPKGQKIKVSEVKKCRVHLLKEIEEIKPKYVLLLGAQAVQAAIDRKITDVQGTIQEVNGISYVATYSPRTIFYDVKKAPQIQRSLDLFAGLIKGTYKGEQVNTNIVEIKTLKQAQRAFKEYPSISIAFDIETTGLNRYKDKINLIGFGNDKVQFILDVGTPYSSFKGYPRARNKIAKYVLKKLNELKVIGSNIKFDNLFCREHYGFSPRASFDVMLASHLLDENTPNGLKENAIFKCGAQEWDINTKLKTGNVENPKDYEEYKQYLAYDILWTYKLYKVFRKELKADSALSKIFKYLVMPAARAYEDIEELGVYIYPERFKDVEEHLKGQLNEVLAKLNECVPGHEDLNWSSSAQIKDLLYKELKLPILETTDAGEPSTSESVLLRLRDHHPVAQLILDYRGIAIQISHFVEGWKERMHEGRLHPNFKLHGTVTGRTACSNPNLQQVPRDKKIRSLIGAPPGYTFVESDYSQLELRVTALVSGDEAMTQLFRMGEDIHTNTGRAVSGKSELSYEERKKAKAVNFGFVYGMSWKKFKDYARDSYEVHLTDKEAEQYRKRFFAAYPDLPKWHARQKKLVTALGQVRNPIGRIRRLPDINSKDKSKKAEAERQAINSPVQGFGSDLCILSMVEAHNYFPREKARCVGTVHDAILWEVRNDYMEEFAKKLKEMMESPRVLKEVFNFKSPVPIVTDVDIGDWGMGTGLADWLKQNHGTLYLSSVANARFVSDCISIYIGRSSKCDDTFDYNFKDLAPSWDLVKYAKNVGRLDEYYKQEYRKQLKGKRAQEKLAQIKEWLKEGKDVQLICFCGGSRECHRGIIGEYFENMNEFNVDYQESLVKNKK